MTPVPIKTVFIASPRDVMRERDIVEEEVKELDQLWTQKYFGYVLKTARWENLRGVDADGVQALIDPHLEESDIFVLILWSRAGTEVTGQLPTEHEFDKAFAQYKKRGRPQILIYRKVDGVDDFIRTADLSPIPDVARFRRPDREVRYRQDLPRGGVQET